MLTPSPAPASAYALADRLARLCWRLSRTLIRTLICSYISTVRKWGGNAIDAIQNALIGNPLIPLATAGGPV